MQQKSIKWVPHGPRAVEGWRTLRLTRLTHLALTLNQSILGARFPCFAGLAQVGQYVSQSIHSWSLQSPRNLFRQGQAGHA